MRLVKRILKYIGFLYIFSFSSIVLATPFSFTFTDTVSTTSTSPPYNIGEEFSITVILDNGGGSNQF